MSNQVLVYLMGGAVAALVVIIIAYVAINKILNRGERKYIRELRQGTEKNKFSSEVLYQKLYMIYVKTPGIKKYLLKLRRRLEIINIEDEYQTRRHASSIITKALLIIIPLTIIIIVVAHSNLLLLGILLLLEIFMIDTVIDGMVGKLDNKLLKQQVEFFSEIRHAYHEYNMVEEAIYEVSQNDELEVSRQGEKIYEILISDNPEEELEKYYDIAPNSYLKEFAGISYLTREFGDRKTSEGASLYLKNLNNITQEMQIEILKRDKLDYVFQSLSVIAVLPVLFIEALKNWAVSNFSFTSSFYNGKLGLIMQIAIVVVTLLSYLLVKKVKDTGSKSNVKNSQNPWQQKVYKIGGIKKIVDLFIPKRGTKQYRELTKLIKDSASKDKIEWIYLTKLALVVVVFFSSIFLMGQLHRVSIDYIYTTPTADYNLISMSDKQESKAMKQTELENKFLDAFRGIPNVKKEEIKLAVKYSKDFEEATEEEINEVVDSVYTKLQTINSEYLKWFEVLIALVLSTLGYMAPTWMLHFQKILRQLEMEDEVMQYQTIILMLMKIERVNVEMILEWLERYANIFKEPISKCVNNYESGAWEALEELKNDISYPQLITIVESLQAAVEKIPIREAFDELDTEREYYKEKRKASNEKLISRKGMIGKTIGFAPMILLFVGYLIIPLVAIGLMSMTTSFSAMGGMI